MATKIDLNDDVDLDTFENIKGKIEEVFDNLSFRIQKRKNFLLQLVIILKDKYENMEITRLARIDDLTKAQYSAEQISLRRNENVSIREEIAKMFRNRHDVLKIPTPFPTLTFNTSLLTDLQNMINSFGEVLECDSIDYSLKEEPKVAIGKNGKRKGEFNSPRGIAINENEGNIFVADRENSRMQVLTMEGGCVCEFGKDELKSPYGVAVNDEHIFITDTFHHAVFKYSCSPIQFVGKAGTKGKSDGQLNKPCGLSVDASGDVYITEYWNYRVSIFTKNLEFIKFIGNDILVHPKDVKLTYSLVIVLDLSFHCIHYFNRNGNHLSSCVTQGYQQQCLVYDPFFFCLDDSENIIISDRLNNCIKIVSKSGDLLQTIGRKGKEKGQLTKPKGICITKSGKIFVTSDNPKYALQSF
ncbi:hypothetical protein LOD99_12527 [Oopsacas minuta]|uniref:Uncharacterized protein n=1 Tax=Oopsacas minuta TaxID=111878 RepID=A0AAV7JCH5_9METZ|nr:hypothetical protein LOD99_12527 [Oopsacas minuta]